jgi:hypothetical protein
MATSCYPAIDTLAHTIGRLAVRLNGDSFQAPLLPEKYHNEATQKIVQTATGMVSLIAALVLGLLVATAKNKFDMTNQTTQEFAANLMLINRALVNFGPEANEARTLLRKYTRAKIEATWPGEVGPQPAPDEPPPWKLLESLQQSLSGLEPKTEAQHLEATTASGAAADLEKATWLEAGKHPRMFSIRLS